MSATEKSQDKTLVTGKDVDEALRFLNDVPVGEMGVVDEGKQMRRVDWTLMPLMFCCYYLQYCDKTLRMCTG